MQSLVVKLTIPIDCYPSSSHSIHGIDPAFSSKGLSPAVSLLRLLHTTTNLLPALRLYLSRLRYPALDTTKAPTYANPPTTTTPVPHPSSLIPRPSSLTPHPSPLIPHPSSSSPLLQRSVLPPSHTTTPLPFLEGYVTLHPHTHTHYTLPKNGFSPHHLHSHGKEKAMLYDGRLLRKKKFGGGEEGRMEKREESMEGIVMWVSG